MELGGLREVVGLTGLLKLKPCLLERLLGRAEVLLENFKGEYDTIKSFFA